DGATLGLCTALAALVQPGDDVLLPDPIYDAYASPIALWGGRPVGVPTTIRDRRFTFDRAGLEGQYTQSARVVLLNTPWNPVGTVLTRPELQDLMDFAEGHDLFVVSDEIYETLVYDGRLHLSPAALSEEARGRTLLVNSLSKTYAMTGWRVATARPGRGHRGDAPGVAAVQPGSATFLQDAAACALRSDQGCVRRMAEEYQARRDLVLGRLRHPRRRAPAAGGRVVRDGGRAAARTALGRGPSVAAARGGSRRPARGGLWTGRRGTLRVSFAAGGEPLERGWIGCATGCSASAERPRKGTA
ncbi:MAG: aminotransferase class I/II-fold pyridoxal phosphate-dependent enzyme, partial [Singulisphaera sp.]